MTKLKKWEIDVPVLCIFFARPKEFEKCFEAVRNAKPRILLLWQDGPRNERPDDVENILKCRKIAENVDWDCVVYKNYHDTNIGCDPSTFLSHKWAFSIVEKCIILEDDIVPNPTFFKFCKDLLDYYENDSRIDRICGQTLFGGVPNKEYSYFFSKTGSSWGWATWKRVADTWEENYKFLDDSYFLDLAKKRFGHKYFSRSIKNAKNKKRSGIPYWETIVGYRTILSSGLVIYPSVNLIQNVGASINATHAPNNVSELPKDVQTIFLEDSNEITFPLKHPPYVIEDYHYFNKIMKTLFPNIFVRFRRKIEHLFRKIGK